MSANTMKNVLQDVLIRLQLSLDECRGQCYYGAGNMFGTNSGLATKIQDYHLQAFPTHCHCYSVNLRVKDSSKEPKLLLRAIDISREIVAFIKNLTGLQDKNVSNEKLKKTMLPFRTLKECLQKVRLSIDVKARIISCQSQLETFNYYFGIISLRNNSFNILTTFLEPLRKNGPQQLVKNQLITQWER